MAALPERPAYTATESRRYLCCQGYRRSPPTSSGMDYAMAARRPAPARTAQIMTPTLDRYDRPVRIACTVDELLEAVGQRLRLTLWKDHVDGYEEITMRALAHLILELSQFHVDEPPPPPVNDRDPRADDARRQVRPGLHYRLCQGCGVGELACRRRRLESDPAAADPCCSTCDHRPRSRVVETVELPDNPDAIHADITRDLP